MTDTVNVPREDIARAVMDAQPYVSGWDAAYRIADSVLSILAAATKAEPVSDPYKLDWRPIDDRAPVGECVMVYWPRMALDDDGEPTDEVLDGDGHISLTMRHSVRAGWEPDNIIEANGDWFGDDFEFGEPTHWAPRPLRPQPLSNPQQLEGHERSQILTAYRNLDASADKDAVIAHLCDLLEAQPEAPKVEQEPVAWLITNKASGVKDLSFRKLADFPFNRSRFDAEPLYTHHTPFSSEMYEALVDLTSWFAQTVQGLDGQVWAIPAGEHGADDALEVARRIIAKHKGPQS